MEWISAKERLPKTNEHIVAVRLCWPAYYWMGHYTESKDPTDTLSYWMPLPEPPKVSE